MKFLLGKLYYDYKCMNCQFDKRNKLQFNWRPIKSPNAKLMTPSNSQQEERAKTLQIQNLSSSNLGNSVKKSGYLSASTNRSRVSNPPILVTLSKLASTVGGVENNLKEIKFSEFDRSFKYDIQSAMQIKERGAGSKTEDEQAKLTLYLI